ncbi:MAG TPA: transketolase [Kofleriaceae bacterium]|nr:transketolase [Kofleriaceae bacterium]
MDERALDELCINTLRTLAMDAVQHANSGHPGLPMGAAPMAYVLWQRHLRHDPTDPSWIDRDRFVLSAGHGSMLLYALLHLSGYDLSLADLRAFRQWDSKTPGHPEAFMTPGVEATTGPLGQGAANAVGMAMAERALANLINRPGHPLIDHFTYALVSDGDLMEGVAAEAGSLAGHLGLGKLIYLYDANDVTLDGPASLAFSEDVGKRYEAYGWHVQKVDGGDTDLSAIDAAITEAKNRADAPSLIIVHTTIGFGAPTLAGTSKSHGSPLGEAEVAGAKRAYGWDPDRTFEIPVAAREHMAAAVAKGASAREAWLARAEAARANDPEAVGTLELAISGKLPAGWDGDLPRWQVGDSVATRSAAGKAQNAICARIPWLIGGDADLGGSTKTVITGGGTFDGRTGAGRNIHFGVREHAMGAIANGFDYHGGIRPFVATFFCFSDYMRPSVRLAALNRQPIIYVWTHDSVGLGEDGPTHQPVEHLMSLRAMPNLWVVRPGDGNEAAAAWRLAMARTDGPTALILSRQDLPILEGTGEGANDGVARGAYVVAGNGRADAILIATGSELCVAMAARERLGEAGISARVVSMPCWEAFAAQDADYRESVLPSSVRARVAIEAGVTFGWQRWVGERGRVIGIDHFGASAPAPVIFEKLGFTAENLASQVRALLPAAALLGDTQLPL